MFPDRARPVGQYPDDPGDGGLPHQVVRADAGIGAVGAQPVPQRVVGRALLQAAQGLPQIRLLPGQNIPLIPCLLTPVRRNSFEELVAKLQPHK